MNRKLTGIMLAVCLLLSLAACTQANRDTSGFSLTFITIGKGDAFLLQSPEGGAYLVDTGKAEDYPQIARTLIVQGVKSLDGIFLTHGHKDHAGCLEQLLTAFPTDTVYISGKDTVSYDAIQPESICEAAGTALVRLNGGEVLDLGGVEAAVWLPDTEDTENENNNSLILRMTYGDTRFLLMGDAEAEEETLLLESGFPVQADVLKLGHHGKQDATGKAFLEAVKPSIGLIAGNAQEDPDTVNELIAGRLNEQGVSTLYSQSTGLGYELWSDGKEIHTSTLPDAVFFPALSLEFSQVNRQEQRVTIRNSSDRAADLTGCLLYSKRGDECFFFPDGFLLDGGAEVTVSCSGHEKPGDLVWPQENVWKPDRDKAVLYDRNMTVIAENQQK